MPIVLLLSLSLLAKRMAAVVAGENQLGSAMGVGNEVVVNDPLQISEQDDREYRHITLPNKMQVSGGSLSTGCYCCCCWLLLLHGSSRLSTTPVEAH